MPSRLQEPEARNVSLFVPSRLQEPEARKVSLYASRLQEPEARKIFTLCLVDFRNPG